MHAVVYRPKLGPCLMNQRRARIVAVAMVPSRMVLLRNITKSLESLSCLNHSAFGSILMAELQLT